MPNFVIFEHWAEFVRGAAMTLVLSGVSLVLALILAIMLVLCRTSGAKTLRFIALSIVEVVRNTPFLVQVFFVFFGLPSLGLRLSPATAAVLALSFNCGAYLAEVLRGGIESIPKGQLEAAHALGLSRLRTFTDVVFRPAMRSIYPSLRSQVTLTVLTSSIVASISANELTYTASVLDAETFRSMEVYLTVAVIYLLVTQVFSWAMTRIGNSYFSYPAS